MVCSTWIHEPRSGMTRQEKLRLPLVAVSALKSTPGLRWIWVTMVRSAPLDDELAAADADREVADVHILFEDVVVQPFAGDADLQLDAALEGQTEIAALVDGVLRLGEDVAVVADLDLVIETGDREELAEDGFEALLLVAHLGRRLGIQELVVAAALQVDEAGYRDDLAGSCRTSESAWNLRECPAVPAGRGVCDGHRQPSGAGAMKRA